MVAAVPGSNNWPNTRFAYSHTLDETLFESAANIAVLGDPGAGKSTSLKKLILDYAGQARQGDLVRFSGIPILIPLRSFARERAREGESYSLLDFLYEHAQGNLTVQCSPGFFEHYLEHGGCLVCFDGLDEVTAPAQRQEVSDIVESFVSRYPYNRYIATSRIAGYGEAPLSNKSFTHFTIVPYSDGDIQIYINKWYNAREKSPAEAQEQIEDLIQTIAKSERLQDLARRPLLLAIIALIHRIEAELPHERVKLYDKCVEAILDTFEGAKKLPRPDMDKHYYTYRRQILEAVAYWMQSEHQGRDVLVHRADLELYIAQWLHDHPDFRLPRFEAGQQAHAFVDLISQRTGLLVERGDNQFNFVHLTFQEYLTAAYIRTNYVYDIQEMWRVVEPHLTDANWREVMLLLLGQLSAFAEYASRLVERILQTEDPNEPILHRHLELATASLADNVRLNADLQNQILDRWLAVIERPLCEEQAAAARRAIDAIKRRPLVATRLLALLNDGAPPDEQKLQVAEFYYDEQPAVVEVQDLLRRIALDQESPRMLRLQAYSLLPFLQKRSTVYELMKRSDDDPGVSAEMLVMHGHTHKIVHWIKENTDGFASLELARLAASEPLFAWIFSATRWFNARRELLSYLHTVAKPEPALLRLLHAIPQAADYHMLDNRRFTRDLQDALVALCKTPQLDPANADAIHCLFALNYPEDMLFDLVTVLDNQGATDDWNTTVMTGFFQNLLGRLQQNTEENGFQDQVMDWTNQLALSSHASLKVAYIQALYSKDADQAQQLLLALVRQHMDATALMEMHIDWHINQQIEIVVPAAEIRDLVDLALQQEPARYSLACLLLGWLYSRRRLELGDYSVYYPSLLAQTESSWVRENAAFHLYRVGLLDKASTGQHLLELANNGSVPSFVRLRAEKRAVELGVPVDSVAILCSIIQDTRAGNAIKDEAYQRLLSNATSAGVEAGE